MLLTTGIAEGAGLGVWETAYGKAREFVANLTDEEKVNLTAGITADSACSGIIPAIPRVGFPGLCVTDAGNGVVCTSLLDLTFSANLIQRGTDYVNAWSSGMHVGARYFSHL